MFFELFHAQFSMKQSGHFLNKYADIIRTDSFKIINHIPNSLLMYLIEIYPFKYRETFATRNVQ